MYISASAPDAPLLSETTIGCFIRLFFWIAACIMRAIWSEAPPAPAATTISTGLVGSQPATAGALASMADSMAADFMIFRKCFIPRVFDERQVRTWSVGRDCERYRPHAQAGPDCTHDDFRERLQTVSANPASSATD